MAILTTPVPIRVKVFQIFIVFRNEDPFRRPTDPERQTPETSDSELEG
jgi:hypothetical protein